MGTAPTGKRLTVTGHVIDRFRGGQVVELWGQCDMLGLRQQLGVVPVLGVGRDFDLALRPGREGVP